MRDNVSVVISAYNEGESVNELPNMEMTIYPNPAKDVINVKTNVQRYEYQLINSVGQVVMNGVLSGEDVISVENINNGIYFLKVVANGEVTVNKVVIQ